MESNQTRKAAARMLRRTAYWLLTNRVTKPLIELTLVILMTWVAGLVIRWMYQAMGAVFIVPWLIGCLALSFWLDEKK